STNTPRGTCSLLTASDWRIALSHWPWQEMMTRRGLAARDAVFGSGVWLARRPAAVTKLVGRDGFEPARKERTAAPGTMPRARLAKARRRRNRLSGWWAVLDSNQRPAD